MATKRQYESRAAELALDMYGSLRDLYIDKKRDQEYQGRVYPIHVNLVEGKSPGVVLEQNDEEMFKKTCDLLGVSGGKS